MPAPLYGQCAFVSLPHLLAQLGEIERKHLAPVRFSAYLLHHDQRKAYGLTLSDVAAVANQQGEWSSLTAVATQAQGGVLRVNVQFFPPPTAHRVRYLIASSDTRRDYAIRQVLTGEPIPSRVATLSRLPSQEVLLPTLRVRADAFFAPRNAGFRQPTLTLHDHFYARPDLSADALVDLCNRLSQQFLRGADFQARLEMLDGDFYLHLDRLELRYLFARQRDKRLLLYLDSRDGDAQWLSLRLMFHPLFTGPNAEVSLLSPQAEAILDLLRAELATEPPTALLPTRHWWRGQAPAELSLAYLLAEVQTLSREVFGSLPAIAWVALADGRQRAGLSLYQLHQGLTGQWAQVRTLAFVLTRLNTGQVLVLWLMRQGAEQPVAVRLGLMWGDKDRAAAVQNWWAQQAWQEETKLKAMQAHLGRHVALLATQPTTEPDLMQGLQALAQRAGYQGTPIQAAQAHHRWDQAAATLHAADHLWAELSYKQPGTVFLTELAQQLGLPVTLLLRDGHHVPESLAGCRVLRYHELGADQARLVAALSAQL